MVYEGINEVKTNIKEDETTRPVLSYSSSKAVNEDQLKKSGKNYIILRLGSVYGYSTDSMRVDIMPNLFSKIASQNGTLKLFAGGRQIKSLVPLIDVARCFKFMEEKNEFKSDIFNLTKDTLTVKEVAEVCKKHNPKITLKETNDEVPNLGFSLSNKKLLNYAHHYEFELSGLSVDDIRKFISEKRIIYDYKADQKQFKWSGKSILKKIDPQLLPFYIQNNINKYSDWMD